MKIWGNRIYLNMPELPESKIEVSNELKDMRMREILSKFDRLKVFAVGDAVTNINVGDEVFVDPQAVRRGYIINIDGSDKLAVSLFDIMHTW